jgi:hypothetical protein
LEIGFLRRNSLYNSKAKIHLGMCEFDPSQGSQAVLRLAIVCNLRLTSPKIPAFLALDFVSRQPILQSRGRIAESL